MVSGGLGWVRVVSGGFGWFRVVSAAGFINNGRWGYMTDEHRNAITLSAMEGWKKRST